MLVLHDVCAENGEVERAADVAVEPERDAATMSDSKGDDRCVERTLKWFIYTMGIVACVCSMSRVFSVGESKHVAGNSVDSNVVLLLRYWVAPPMTAPLFGKVSFSTPL